MAVPVPAPVPPPAADSSRPVKPPSTLLFGPPGSGKTDSIGSAVEAGLELFFFGIEANATDTLLDSCRRRKVDMSRVHYRYIPPANPDLDTLLDMAGKIGRMSYEDLSNIKSGIGKDKTQQCLVLLQSFKNFVDDKDGQSYGSIFDLKDDAIVALDSMSGLNDMCFLQTVGYKPAPAQGEWGVAMHLEMSIIKLLCSSLNCFLAVTAHADKETNEVTGARTITSSALGQKNAQKIMRPFSEIVYTKRGRDGKSFRWSTWEDGLTIDLKSRALPISSDIQPTFKTLVEAHQRRKLSATSS